MPRSALALARLVPASDAAFSDVPLLASFLANGSTTGEAAFAELVRRHGPMVLAACRRVLGNQDDSDDAFQATFLVLARKAGSIHGNLAGWLYAVAVRTARGVRVMRDRRRKHELARGGLQPAVLEANGDHDLAAVIDEELAKLPEHYREAIVLSELRGLTRKQAAVELGIPEGTLSSRLATAKRKLAARLTARGLSAPAALAAALAPASVSAALVRSAVAATHGLAAPVASAAASAIVKAMLFDQLKSVALAAGILLSVACGGWAVTGSPGDDTRSAPPTAQPATDPIARLVAQLGADEFADREAAQIELRKLGAMAVPALKAAQKSDSPEIRERAAKVLAAIRTDARDALVKSFDAATDVDPDHPVWKRFKNIAGNDAAARKLFAELIADPRCLRLLDDAGRDPERAGDLYAAEVGRAHARVQLVLDLPTTGDVGPDALPWPELPTILYLGTYPSSTGKVKEGWKREGHMFAPDRKEWDKHATTPALKRVFAAWLVRRDHPKTIERGLDIAVASAIDSLLPLARKAAADAKNPVTLRLSALAAVAQFGAPADRPLFETLFADKTPVATFPEKRTGPLPAGATGTVTTQARDAAAGMVLLLHGEDPFAYDFWHASGRWQKIGDRPYLTRYELTHFGFYDGVDRLRAAAHAKVTEFLAKQPKPEKKEEPKPDPAVVKLVAQLGAPEFADREAAAKALRERGMKAEAALKIGLRSDDAEVRGRSAKVLAEIRNDALDALAKGFDPAKDQQPDHPVWKRFKTIAGDSQASRELFARIIENNKWLRTLDKAEADPTNAGHVYRVGIAEMFRDFHIDPAKSPPWPCDRPEEVAYLLLLGSHPDPNPPAKLTGDEVVPTNLRGVEFLGRGIIFGEGQVLHANGVSLGLQGKIRFFNTPEIVGAAGTDRVFARLFAAWLAQRSPSAELVPNAFRIAATYRAAEVLPIARRYAANDFDPKRDVPLLATIKALELIAQSGTRADLPLFERHFGDKTNVAAVDKPRDGGAKDYYRPAPLRDTTQLRDVALGLALLLHGENPEDFGFVVRRDTFKQKDGRYTIPWSTQLHLGFENEASRTAGHAKAKKWLDEQPKAEPKKEEPKPDPEIRKLVEQLGAPEFADREAAQKQLRALGKNAETALRFGLRSEEPEIRTRAAKVLGEIRKDRLWDVFAKVAGDDKAARELFAHIASSERGMEALKAALDEPARADEFYRTRTAELMRIAAGHAPVDAEGKASVPTAPDVWSPPPPPLGDIAGWMLLGALQSGKAEWREVTHKDWEGRLSSHVPFLPEDDYTSAKPIAAAYTGELSRPLKKLTAAWLAKRRENDMLRAGFALSIRYDIADAVAAARIVLKEPKPTDIRPWNLATAAIFIGLHGGKDDLPLLARHAADDRNYQTFLNLPKDFSWVGAIPSEEGRDLFCQVRDAVAVSMCKLAGKNPADIGFPPFPAAKHPNGAPMSLSSATKVGFIAKADRAKAFEKAAEWLKSFEAKEEPKKEEPGPVAKLVKQLGAQEFVDRETATAALHEIGEPALVALRAAAARDDNPEVRKRAADLVKAIESPAYGLVRTLNTTAGVCTIAFAPRGETILTGSLDGTVRVVETATGRTVKDISVGSEGIGEFRLAILPKDNGAILRYARYDLDPVKFRFGFEGHTAPILPIAVSSDGKWVLTGSADGTIRLWDSETGKEGRKIEAHRGKRIEGPGVGRGEPVERFEGRGVRDAAFSRDDTRIATGGNDGAVRVWNADDGAEVTSFATGEEAVLAVAFLLDRNQVAAAGTGGVIRVWETTTGKEVKKFTGHTGVVYDVAVSPDGKRLVSVGLDKTVRVWDIASGSQLRCFRGHTHFVYAVAISPDGLTVVSGGEDKTARIWRMPK